LPSFLQASLMLRFTSESLALYVALTRRELLFTIEQF
jgi:hypothetical protein